MSDRWLGTIECGVLGLAALVAGIVLGDAAPPGIVIVAAAAAPATVGLAVWAKLETLFPRRALVGGATVGPAVAIASHAAVAAFAVAFLLGFAETGRALLHTLRVDPSISAIITSPWVLLAMAEYAVVAPITEEAGKYLGASLEQPATRSDAFLAGVVAGVGFAMVENVVYAAAATAWGGPWQAVAIVRIVGAPVHPLATGLVALGWWDTRARGDGRAFRRSLAGVGVHALWNGTMVVLLVIATTTDRAGTFGAGDTATLVFAACLGIVLAAALWWVTDSVSRGRDFADGRRAHDARPVAAWVVLAASLLVPVSVLIFAFPGFRG
jgi:RsiW-degrading membrane proteinase PrsW (M82 family)